MKPAAPVTRQRNTTYPSVILSSQAAKLLASASPRFYSESFFTSDGLSGSTLLVVAGADCDDSSDAGVLTSGIGIRPPEEFVSVVLFPGLTARPEGLLLSVIV